MELKALAGDRDLYDVLRKQRRKQASVDAAAADGYVVKKMQSSTPVFDFINVKLANKKSGNHFALAVRRIRVVSVHQDVFRKIVFFYISYLQKLRVSIAQLNSVGFQ